MLSMNRGTRHPIGYMIQTKHRGSYIPMSFVFLTCGKGKSEYIVGGVEIGGVGWRPFHKREVVIETYETA